MATSVFVFRGIATTSSDLFTAEFEVGFNATSNVGGEDCYVECTMFTWDHSTELTTPLTSRDAVTFTASWAQPASGVVTQDGSLRVGNVPMGTVMNGQFYSHGPVLCYIPEGPSNVRFQVFRPDGGVIAKDVNDNIFFAAFKMVSATSRQPPIGT
jgi:hypothetical protein